MFGRSGGHKYNFAAEVRTALEKAREASIEMRHDYVGTEHVLLGLMNTNDGQTIFAALRIDTGEIKRLIESHVKRGTRAMSLGELPYTSRSKKVLEYAMREAKDWNHDHVNCSHLLIGLLREEKGIAAQILNHEGVTLQFARAIVFGPVEPEPVSRFEIRVDDTSDVSIYEQIIKHVEESVATGVLGPGERLPTVRRMADALDIAPGTVARAYSELERRGVVVTEGARGTRVADRQRKAVPEAIRPEALVGLLRPVAVAAYHLGATATDLRTALETAMTGIFSEKES